MLWGQLMKLGVAPRNLALYNAVRDAIESNEKWGQEIDKKNGYVTIHSRWLEGQCERRLGNLLPSDECHMTPSYIKQIMEGKIDRPIVFISDGQKEEVLTNLQNDSEIGPALIIANDIAGGDVEVYPQPWSDMMIGIMGDVFIGTRVSSFATMIGLSRVVMGADPKSNYIYTSGHVPNDNDHDISNDGQQGQGIRVCESCLFLCDEDKGHLCGNNVIYTRRLNSQRRNGQRALGFADTAGPRFD